MKSIYGTKVLMTRIFDKDGVVIPVTLLKFAINKVTYKKTIAKDGYEAYQIGAGSKKKLNKPETGHLKNVGSDMKFRHLFEVKSSKSYEIGHELKLDQFSEGEIINVTAISKGKGFSGTVKRHNFHTGPKTHGSNNYRQPGSIGSTYPERVIKGKKMAGHMGHAKITVKNLKIVKIDQENNEMLVRGAIPGPQKSNVLVWSNNES